MEPLTETNAEEIMVKELLLCCKNCNEFINLPTAEFIILDIQAVTTERQFLPMIIKINLETYKLVFVNEAKSASGEHFFCKLQLNDFEYFFDSLDGGLARRINQWPNHFQFPSIVIYKKQKCNFINSDIQDNALKDKIQKRKKLTRIYDEILNESGN